VLPGTGTIARYGDVILWWEPGPTAPTDLAHRLVALVRELADEGDAGGAAAGGRLAGVLREADAQAVTALVLALPSPTGLRVVVHGPGRVLAHGIEINRGWEDKDIGWPDSMALGRADSPLRPPTAGSPYDLIEGGVPGSGAAIALVARSVAPVAPVEAVAPTTAVPSIATPDLTAPVQPVPPAPAPGDDDAEAGEPAVDPALVPPLEPTILATAAPAVTPVALAPDPADPWSAPPADVADAPTEVLTPVDSVPIAAAPVEADPWEAAPPEPTGQPVPSILEPEVAAPPVEDPTISWDGALPAADDDAMATMPLGDAIPAEPPPSSADPAPAGRPPEAIYGAIILDDGSVWPLDADYVIGSAPGGSPDVLAGRMRPLPVVDPSGQAHPAHAEVRHGDGGSLLLVPRATTFVLRPGGSTWQEVPLHTGVALEPGARVSVGQRTFTLAAPTS
jgi:hypothetical protein